MEKMITSGSLLQESAITTEDPKLDQTKIWVGGLPPRTSREKLKASFTKAFEITDEDIINKITLMIKLGYGFISVPTV